MRVIAAVALTSAVFFAPALATAQDAAAPAAAPAAAAPAPTAPPAAADNSGVNLDEVVCKQLAPPTGSRLGGRHECHTVREWNQRQLDSQNNLMHLQHSGSREAKGG